MFKQVVFVCTVGMWFVSGLSIGGVYSQSVESGIGKLNGLLQFWYQNDSSLTPKDTFRLRRAEIKLFGEIKPEILWSIMVDPAQIRDDDTKTETVSGTKVITSVGRKSPLQDFVITLKPCKNCSLDFGQYKVPFGMEGLESSSKLDFVERAMIGPILKWADYRDIGFIVSGNLKLGSVKIWPALGLFNGEGQNKLDVNNQMDFVGRVVVKPAETLHIGLAHYKGKSTAAETKNIRTGIELKYINNPMSVYGEYATGKITDANTTTYYTAITYNFLTKYQAALRYDRYDKNTDTADDSVTETTIGLNYFIDKHNAKVQLNYVFCGEEGQSLDDDVFRASVQITY